MADKESAFTVKEVEHMAAAMQCLKEGIPTNAMINTAKFASLTGLTEGSSKVIWNKLRQKLAAQGGSEGAFAGPKTPKEPKPKRTPASKRKGGEDRDTSDTPTKKLSGKKAKAAEIMKEEDAEKDEEADELEQVFQGEAI